MKLPNQIIEELSSSCLLLRRFPYKMQKLEDVLAKNTVLISLKIISLLLRTLHAKH